MKYSVDVKEISYGTIVVDAESPEEAIEKAEGIYHMGNTIWQAGEYELSDPKQIPGQGYDG